jgi:hypothetical protein
MVVGAFGAVGCIFTIPENKNTGMKIINRSIVPIMNEVRDFLLN